MLFPNIFGRQICSDLLRSNFPPQAAAANSKWNLTAKMFKKEYLLPRMHVQVASSSSGMYTVDA